MSNDTYRARYWRYFSEGEEECDRLEQAIAFLAGGLDRGELAARDVIGPDGVVVLEGDELDRRIDVYLGA